MNINWFPGHMAKTRRTLTEQLKLVDVVIELLDSRIPYSSQNPDIRTLTSAKESVVLMTKSDLSDEKANSAWRQHFNSIGKECIFVDILKGKGLNDLKETLRKIMHDQIEYSKSRGRLIRTIRTMVVGIPNVGKSSFINKIAGKSVTMTGDRPGVTRSNQWVRVNDEIDLLDTPGVLWPKFEDEKVGLALASTGAIKDEVFDIVEVAAKLIEWIKPRYGLSLMERYKLKDLQEDGYGILAKAGKNRGCIISGGEIDYYRIAAVLLDEFRAGRIGRISLEWP